MRLGDLYFDFGELGGDFVGQHGNHRVFGVEMAGIDEVQTQIMGIPELIVLHIGGDKGIAASVISIHQLAAAGTAAVFALSYLLWLL